MVLERFAHKLSIIFYSALDTLPSLGILTINVFATADSIVIPIETDDYFSARAMEALLNTISKVRKQINPKLAIEGVLITKMDKRKSYKDVIYDAAKTSLKDAFSTISEDRRLTFTYDYGNNWKVSLIFEKVIEDKTLSNKELPRVLEGAGYGIIEDCGGVHRLADIAKAFKKKKGRQYDAYCDLLGITDLDLEAFDVDDMNFRLKKVPTIYTDIYESGVKLSKRSIDLLQRKYKN